MNKTVLKLTYSGLMAALTFISTSILAFPIAFTNGYIHLGDGFVLSCGVVLGKKHGALAAGIGSALADIYLGYASWALPTFIIKALMAYLVGWLFEDLSNHGKVYKMMTAFTLMWFGFIAVLGSILNNSGSVYASTELLLADGLIAEATELGARTAFTANILIIAAIVLPLLLLCIYLYTKNSVSRTQLLNKVATFLTAGTVMIFLYYATYGIMYGNWVVPVFSVPSNLVQYVLGIVIATALMPMMTVFRGQLAQ